MTNIPPGWYPDPQDETQQRYWDGATWTDQVTPAGAGLPESTQPLPAPFPTSQSAAPARPWWKRRWVQVTAGIVVAFFAIGAIGNAIDPVEENADTAGPTSAATTAPPATVTATVTKTQKPAAPATKKAVAAPTPEKAVAASKTPKPAAATSEAAPTKTSWTMPNLTGKVLQTAQDDLQLLTGNPLFISTSTDALGAGRLQVLDANWKVCGQTPAAGTTFTETTVVTFDAVKLTETCP